MENSAGEQFHLGLMCWGAARSFDIGVFDAQSIEVSDEIEDLQWAQKVYLGSFIICLGDPSIPEDEIIGGVGLLPPRRCGGANYLLTSLYRVKGSHVHLPTMYHFQEFTMF